MVARLVVKAGLTDKSEYLLEPGKSYTIGRSREAEVIVKDQQSSRRHCTLEAGPTGEWSLTDQNSSNGTYVNRHRVTTHPLRPGDLVQVGRAVFEFGVTAPAGAAAPAPAAPKAEEPAPEPAPSPQAAPAAREPVAAPEPAPPAAPPAREPVPPPEHAPVRDLASTDAPAEGDLKDLFEFLDRIETGPKPPAQGERKERAEERPAAGGPPPPRPAPAQPPKKDDENAPFLGLVDSAEMVEPLPKKPAPPPKEEKERGGLLAFLRKKKQPP